MFDELRGLDVDVSCEYVEIAVFSEAEKLHSRPMVVSIPPLDMSRVSV